MSPFLLIFTSHIKTNKHAEMHYHISTSTGKQGAVGMSPFFIKQGDAEHIKHTQTCTQVLH